MGHLGAPRVVQLAHERFYWPNTEDDITHFVTKVCPCLKQRQPNLSTGAPLHSVTTSYPFELVQLTFYIWSKGLVVIYTSWSSLTTSLVLHKHMQQRIRRPQLRLIACLMTLN